MKQYSLPVLIAGNESKLLKKISFNENTYDEEWIQKICYNNPNILPIDDIETIFSGLIPVCMEMSVNSGFVDLIYINEYGFITIGECKLWRNPESRRKVIGQILDYAKDISSLSYEELEEKCLKARGEDNSSLFEIISNEYPDIEEHRFIDNVQMNLKKGRFLLVIIGDGIQENMEEITEFLNKNGNMNFTLSLIELPIYEIPNEEKQIITPRVVARTREIERVVFIEGAEKTNGYKSIGEKKETRIISESVFYERLSESIGYENVKRFKELLREMAEKLNVFIKLGRGKRLSLNIKSPDDVYNFASIQEDGEVWFYGIVSKTEELGNKNIGIEYLEGLSAIVNGEFDKSNKEWYWCIKKNGKYINIKEYLLVGKMWMERIEQTLNRIIKYRELE